MNVLITGSINYTISNDIKNLLFKIKNKYNINDIHIASRDGKTGVDKSVKRIALEFGFDYNIFNLYHTEYNNYSAMPRWKYGKQYSPRHYYWRDADAVKWADLIIIYCRKPDYKEIEVLIKTAKKHNKKTLIIN